MASQATPEIRKKNFTLVNGQNTISIKFAREGAGQDDTLELSGATFQNSHEKAFGKVEKTFTIQNTAPDGFKTVTVAD